MRYLIDTSALVRMLRGQVDRRWHEVVDRGLIALCQPVLVETLTGVGARDFEVASQTLRTAYPWVPVPDDAWAIVDAVQRDLAAASQHQGLSVADHLVVAAAMKLKLVVLHEDGDFETVARVLPQFREQRVSGRGPG